MDASCNAKPAVVAVVGPTATGKTALGVALAQQFSGEVISADSMQIYRGLDVGTAKVTPQETCGIPHHGVDILTPEKTFSVADFTALAGECIQDITGRGHLPHAGGRHRPVCAEPFCTACALPPKKPRTVCASS